MTEPLWSWWWDHIPKNIISKEILKGTEPGSYFNNLVRKILI
jgi:hypothetical protein